MQEKNINVYTKSLTSNWVTIQEAVNIANKLTNIQITDSDIYRHALYGKIRLSIYFQSPPILRKVKSAEKKNQTAPY